MDRKERLDKIIKDLEAQYPPDEKFRAALKPLLAKLYEPNFPEKEIDHMIQLLEETYSKNYESKRNLDSARKGIKEIAENIKTFGQYFQQMTSGMEDITKSLRNIKENASETLKIMQDNHSQLQKIKENVDTSNQTLKTAKEKAEQTEQYLKQTRHNLNDALPQADTKKLN